MNYFISDTHFGHLNIIRFDNRPFTTLEEMDGKLIENWNNIVNKEDTVYILGDFSWYKADKTTEILKQLKGHKRLIKGNHDKFLHNSECKKQFDSVVDYDEITIDNKKVILSHYFIPLYNCHYHGAIMLHGHTHNSEERYVELEISEQLNKKGMTNQIYNVGCMLPYMNYTPRTLQEILNSNIKQ